MKFRSQQTSHMEPSASTTVIGPVGERPQVGTEDTSVLDYSVPLRRLHDSGAGHQYPDLLTYLLTYLLTCSQTVHVTVKRFTECSLRRIRLRISLTDYVR